MLIKAWLECPAHFFKRINFRPKRVIIPFFLHVFSFQCACDKSTRCSIYETAKYAQHRFTHKNEFFSVEKKTQREREHSTNEGAKNHANTHTLAIALAIAKHFQFIANHHLQSFHQLIFFPSRWHHINRIFYAVSRSWWDRICGNWTQINKQHHSTRVQMHIHWSTFRELRNSWLSMCFFFFSVSI